jgi:hypothetical protein
MMTGIKIWLSVIICFFLNLTMVHVAIDIVYIKCNNNGSTYNLQLCQPA